LCTNETIARRKSPRAREKQALQVRAAGEQRFPTHPYANGRGWRKLLMGKQLRRSAGETCGRAVVTLGGAKKFLQPFSQLVAEFARIPKCASFMRKRLNFCKFSYEGHPAEFLQIQLRRTSCENG